jgi:hypothetical protein
MYRSEAPAGSALVIQRQSSTAAPAAPAGTMKRRSYGSIEGSNAVNLSIYQKNQNAAGGSPYTLTAEAGSYLFSGQDATLTYAAAGAYTLTAEAGSYILAGQDATLTYAGPAAYVLTAEAGAYFFQGQSATLTNSGEVITATATTEPNSISWGALVAKTWGKDYVKPEWDYEFSNGRRFLEKKNPYA